MKKALALVLAMVLVACVAVPAAANDTLDASVNTSLPALTNANENVRLHEQDQLQDLSEEKQKAMAAAEEALKNVDTNGLDLRYFFYTEILNGESNVSLDFEMIPHNVIMFMQYINGMWVTMEHSVGEDETIIIPKNSDAPFAIFVDSVGSVGGTWTKLIPVLTEKAHLIVQLHTLEEVVTLSEEIQARIAEAKDALEDACPADFAVKYFFELEIIGTDGAVDVDFEPIAHDTVIFKQYVDGTWVELKSSLGDDGIITVYGLLNGPVAVFVQ